MVNTCQVSTPSNYVIQMLDQIKYKKNIFGKRVLENSCGQGNILLEIVNRYIADASQNNISDKEIVSGIENDIVAYEVDEKEIDICIRRLDELIKKLGLPQVSWNINNKDFLKQRNETYDYIIGNPPYITYHNLDIAERKYLRENFISCEEGRFDYSYAFIEASIKALRKNGKLIYLVPYSVVKNKFANRLREYMTPYITAIYDYTGIKIFPDATTSSVMILMENRDNKKHIEYYEKRDRKKRKIPRKRLNGKWNFADDSGFGYQRFGDHFEVCNSVATLYNKAYILQQYTEQECFYCVDGMEIEKQVVYPAISMKSFNQKRRGERKAPLILFPYKVTAGNVARYGQDEFEKQYPMAVRYLRVYENELKKRKKDEKALWFEYGRSQAVGRVFGEKLVMPMVVTNNVSICNAADNVIPYAGYFVKCKNDTTMTLEDAKRILKSNEFWEYVKAYGTPTTPTSYRISVNDIKEYRF